MHLFGGQVHLALEVLLATLLLAIFDLAAAEEETVPATEDLGPAAADDPTVDLAATDDLAATEDLAITEDFGPALELLVACSMVEVGLEDLHFLKDISIEVDLVCIGLT